MKVIEENCPFKTSRLWAWQTEAYRNLGPEAWSRAGVPSYLTSNPLIAAQYARLVEAFAGEEPVTIVDLGAGSGRFAYLFLRTFRPRGAFRYVMTDVAEKNVAFWKEHRLLANYFEQGVLEAEVLDHSAREFPFLKKGERTVLIANYFFDTIPQALYRWEGDVLQEGRVTLRGSRGERFLEDLEVEMTFAPVAEVPLSAPYRGTSDPFLLPIAGCALIEAQKKWVEAPLLLLATDQGWASPNEWKGWGVPQIDRHGTFSLAVNYDALLRFVSSLGGKGWTVSSGDGGYASGAFVWGGDVEKVWNETVGIYSTWDYWKEGGRDDVDVYTLLEKGLADPQNLYAFLPKLLREVPAEREQWAEMALRCADNAFPIGPEDGHFYLNVGVLLYHLGAYSEALELFDRAESWLGPHPLIVANRRATLAKSIRG